jgi:hypothetical protein
MSVNVENFDTWHLRGSFHRAVLKTINISYSSLCNSVVQDYLFSWKPNVYNSFHKPYKRTPFYTMQINSTFCCSKIQYNTILLPKPGSRDSSVGIATSYGLDDQGVRVRVPVGSRIFSSPRRPDRLWDTPSLLSNGYRGLFPWG